jgi:hypothetical protein
LPLGVIHSVAGTASIVDAAPGSAGIAGPGAIQSGSGADIDTWPAPEVTPGVCDGLTGPSLSVCTLCTYFQSDIAYSCSATAPLFIRCYKTWDQGCSAYNLDPPTGFSGSSRYDDFCPQTACWAGLDESPQYKAWLAQSDATVSDSQDSPQITSVQLQERAPVQLQERAPVQLQTPEPVMMQVSNSNVHHASSVAMMGAAMCVAGVALVAMISKRRKRKSYSPLPTTMPSE